MTEEHKRKIAQAHLGMKLSDEAKKKKSLAMKKWWTDKSHRELMSENHRGNKGYWKGKFRATPWMYGEGNWNWQGGVWAQNYEDRTGGPYRRWRRAVLERDGRVCVNCGAKENLEADHIKSFAKYPELRFEVENGRTLCNTCHLLLGVRLLGRTTKYEFHGQYDDQ